MRRAAVVLVIGLLGALLVSSRAQSVESSTHASQKVDEARSAAVLSGDKGAFLASIDPLASEAFKTAQGKLFDGLHSLPISSYVTRVTEVTSGDLAPGLGLNSHYGTTTYLPETQVAMRFGAYDDRDDVDTYWYTYVERNGTWYIASDTDANIVGLNSASEIWDSGTLSVQSTSNVLMITTPTNVLRGRDLMSVASSALATFDARWTSPWNDKVVVVDPGSDAEASRLIKTTGNIADYSAFTVYTPRTETGWATTAPRVFAEDANLMKESFGLQVQTLVHEFTHYAEAEQAGPFTPTWLHEGTAEWVRLGMPSYAAPGVAKPTLPATSDFVSATPGTVSQAYKSASSAVAFVDAVKGRTGPTDLFQAVGARRLNIGSPSYNVDQALQQTTGLDTADFQSAWQAAVG